MLTSLMLTWMLSPALAAEVPTGDSGHAQNPQWSSDGAWLAFEKNNMSNSIELWLVSVEGGQPGDPSQLKIPGASSGFGGGGSTVAAPTWTEKPQQMMIFEGSNARGVVRLYYAAPGTGVPGELLSSDQISGNLGFPQMSPDGERLAFVADGTGGGDLYIWEVSSNEISSVFPTRSAEHSPSFNADSDQLVFSRDHSGTEDLFIWSGGNTTPPLKGGNGDQTRPVWVGDQIVYFTSERGDGHWDIAVTAATGGNRTILARDARLPARASPEITPDGQAVVYASSDPQKGDRLFVSRLDGSSTQEIATGLVACGEPDLIQVNGRVFAAFTALPPEGSDWRRLHIVDITGKY